MTRVGDSSLFADLDVDVELDAHVGPMTWYGVGGRADVLIRPRSIDALKTLYKRCARQGETVRTLGRGANLLVSDEGVDGVVVQLNHPDLRAITYEEKDGETVLRAMAGADLAKTLNDATRRGLTGLQHMAGIPATIGGAVRMNAGGKFGAISDTLRSVLCLTSAGETVTYPKEQLAFGYRRTNIPDPIILGASFHLTPDDPIELRKRVKEIFNFKKSTQPLADHSAGCTFKNPWDPTRERFVSAGQLIDEAGLKGARVGGAAVSDQHANFIITEGGATAGDVIELLEFARKRVFQHSGFQMETEIDIWRRDR